MSQRAGQNLSFLFMLLLLQACATGRAVGGSGFGDDVGPGLDSEMLEQARRAEAERVRSELWAVVGSASNVPGATWEFRYWSEGGALTLLSFQQTRDGEGHAAAVDVNTFLPRWTRNLPELLGMSAREVTFTLTREEAGWTVNLDTSEPGTAPPQARTLPSPRGGVSEATYSQVLSVARGMARLIRVAPGSHSRLEVEVVLEDSRVVAWQPTREESPGGGENRAASETLVARVAAVLQPFTQGLGVRVVRLVLEGTHRAGEAQARWHLAEARTPEPPRLPREVEDFAREYRAMHERILYDFQHELRDSAAMLAGFSLEQLAYWYVGGLVARGAVVLFKTVAPTVAAFLSQGGKAAVRWFRNLLARTPAAERNHLARLWLKAETHGLPSLTAAERTELQELMGRMEKLLGTPLGDTARNNFHRWARAEYFQLHNPQLAAVLGRAGMGSYQVHHIYPLQYAHLFPKLDINAKANLAGVAQPVHESLSMVWASLGRASERMRPQDVTKVVEIVNRHYRRWFDRVYNPRDEAALFAAYRAALREVAEVKARLIH